jgi:hypothetical protein
MRTSRITSLNRSAKMPGIKLRDGQVKDLFAIVNSKETYTISRDACYASRMGIVFYDKNNIVKGYISICFECRQLLSQPHIKNREIGLSSKGLKQLQALCFQLNLEECKHEK